MPSTPTLNSDDALLARLNALRTSSVTLSETESPLAIPKKVETPESALSSRLKALRTTSEASTDSLPRPSSPPPTPAPITPSSRVEPHGPREGSNLDDMGRPRGPPNESLEHGPIRPSMPATRNSANAIFREGRRQAEALEQSIKSANFSQGRFGSEGDIGKLKMDAAKAAQDAGKAVAKKEDKEREHERRVEVWREEDRVRGEKREKRLKDEAAKAIEKAKRTLATKNAEFLTGDAEEEDDESGKDTDESDAARERRRRLRELESEDDYAEPHRDEDAEADAILAEMMDDVALGFEEDARKGLFQQDSPLKLSPAPAFTHPITSREIQAVPGSEAEQDESVEDEFQKAMKKRMIALRSPSPQLPSGFELPGAPSTEPVDSLGLPSAPTSHVEVRGTGSQVPRDYICKVCYAPATVFCEGCEEDFEECDTKEDAMFCARCWKEVHLGEGAGDERKHDWTPVRMGK